MDREREMKKVFSIKVQLAYQKRICTTVVADNESEAKKIARDYIIKNPDCLWISTEEKERVIE